MKAMHNRVIIHLLAALLVSGCSSLTTPVSDQDPLEGVNRQIHAFNTTTDKLILKPLATAYDATLPNELKTGVGNVFSNLAEVSNVANNLLQGKLERSARSLGRFGINSTYGLLGFIDLATPMGLEPAKEDLGQTLAVWGVPSGPYVVLPFFGPSNVRDATANIVAMTQLDEKDLFIDDDQQTAATVLGVVHQRYRLLPTDALMQAAAIDPYNYTKNSYTQYRSSAINDAKRPMADAANEEKLFEQETEFNDSDLFGKE